MGNNNSKGDKIKRDKNHNTQKMFRLGISFGRNDLNLEGHLQMGYNSKTIKNYRPIQKQSLSEVNVPPAKTETEKQFIQSSEAVTTDE